MSTVLSVQLCEYNDVSSVLQIGTGQLLGLTFNRDWNVKTALYKGKLLDHFIVSHNVPSTFFRIHCDLEFFLVSSTDLIPIIQSQLLMHCVTISFADVGDNSI